MPMSDKRLAIMCREYKEHRAASEELKKPILNELNRRGVLVGQKVDGVEKYGVRLRKKARRTRVFSITALKDKLTRAQRQLVIYEAVKVPVLDELVKRGDLSADDVKSCLDHEDTSEPYIDVQLLSP